MEGLILLEKYFLLFIIYAVGGWIVEEIYCSICEKKFVNRGFMIGPICPIYGFGGLFMTMLLTPFREHPALVFCLAVLLCAVLEYFTSYIMEKIFNARWWDYSDRKYNLNGRICLRNLIPFGIFGMIIIYVFNPFIFNNVSKLSQDNLHILAGIIAIITLIDFVVSMHVVSKVTSTAERLSKDNPKDDTNEITKQVKKELKETVTGKRLVDAYPDFTTLKVKIKKVATKSKEAAKEAVVKSKKVVKNTAKKSKSVAKGAVEKSKKAMQNTKQKVKKAKTRENN